ncbi:alpha/beta fold hydrolase [Thermoactinomyces mirandus]|uniref:Alpha/beta fold hydrolase n=1 Tax=Thermoactinomyces mirandus TaxID=2756294 RepID=A0A7W1XRY1_9BACL|nr:alpha/beta hydrolase [Thermoactinomyces mirandus]MBA4602178.1 alpha/beta fold hydrolase [Thermoactinomyces mirandus]
MNHPTCVWISGWSAAKEIWMPFLEVFPDQDHLLVDFLSCSSPGELMKELYHAVSRVNGPVTVIGWSLGAMVALKWMESAAPRVRQAYLIGGAMQFVRSRREDCGWDDRVLRQMIRQLKKEPEKVVARFDRNLFSGQEHVAGIAGMWRQTAPSLPSLEALEAGLQFLREYRFSPTEDSKKVPVCLLFGKEDRICPPEGQQQWMEAFRQVYFSVWENTGHAPFFTRPDLFKGWLRSGVDQYE